MKLFRSFLSAVVFALATQGVAASGFVVTSPQVHENGKITEEQVFNSFGCTGGNISPALAWRGAPVGTKSFAVTVYDLDAPTGSGWWHWVVFNIPATATTVAKNAGSIAANLLPAGSIQSRTDFGQPGYGGPCPPVGSKPHRYQITTYALKVDKLPLDENAPAAMVGFYVYQNLLGKAVLNVSYGR